MGKQYRLTIALIVLVGMMAGITWAAPNQDYLVFCQKDGVQETLYLSGENDTTIQTVASGADLAVFLLPRHLVYSTGHRLFEYNLNSMKGKPLAQLDPMDTLNQVLVYDSTGPDQAFVVTTDEMGSTHWYVLEFSDGSLRRLDEPGNTLESSTNGGSSEPRSPSPDGTTAVTIHRILFSQRLEIRLVPGKTGSNLKKWTLPQQFTTLPDFPIWSPDSRYFAFYARRNDQPAGFYDLYLFDRESAKMDLIQSQVFTRLPFENPVMGEFTPSWSPDSRYLVYEYQPYGLPTESSILRYEVRSKNKLPITQGRGERRAPVWSPSGRTIFFIMNTAGMGSQVYRINSDGTNERKIAPDGGITVWAEWYRTNRG